MNRSKIEWCDYTWNPITGCTEECNKCPYRKYVCSFGSADNRFNLSKIKMYKQDGELRILDSRFISETGYYNKYPFGMLPTYHRYRLESLDVLTIGKNILCGSIGEMYGHAPWCYEEILNVCKRHSHNNYMFLSGIGYREIGNMLPKEDNLWYGSVIYKKGDPVFCADGYQHFLYTNPLEDLEPDNYKVRSEWVIIGTGGCKYGRKNNLPNKQWVEDIVSYADRNNIPVFMESTLKALFPEGIRQEYPKQLMWSQGKQYSGKIREKMMDACGKCKVVSFKHDMIAIHGQVKRGQTIRRVGYLCKACFVEMCKAYNFKDILGGNENGQEKLQKNQ